MVNESETNKVDFFAYNQFSARDLPVPRFGKPQLITGGVSKPVRSIAWSCDGKRLATGTEFKGLRIWETRTSSPSSSRPTPHNGHIASLAFSPVDPNILVSGCKSSSAGAVVAVWDLTSPKEAIATFNISGDVLHLAFHPSGQHFAVVCPRSNRDEVFFYHLTERDGTQVWAMREDIGMGGPGVDIGFEEINSLRFSNSGKLVCAVSNDGSINAWAYPQRPRQLKLDEPLDNVGAGKGAAETLGSTPRSGTPDRDEGEKPPAENDVEMADDSAAQADPVEADGKAMAPVQLATLSAQEIEQEKKRARQLQRLRHAVCHSASLLALAFDPLGRFLAAGGQDALLSLLDTREWICQRTFDACTGAIRHLAFSPDGELIAIGGDDNYIAVVSIFSGQTIAKLLFSGAVMALCWHPKKNWLAWSVTGKSTMPQWYVAYQE
ncbi:WD40-repeat-containing domain protein [Kockovaella imperatae]|uniref:WD40-repeat-containing domain protein n=1 Tax=Kockovaella imperatae TaxID=4999 RepID=A0A1Y1UAB5_9TREE|nr:WD40-repeat-containing domain protein [Kockovaella imperatae]ORX34436.1 WD40-repeat-containing domain protein [Kockovaella imperatae]